MFIMIPRILCVLSDRSKWNMIYFILCVGAMIVSDTFIEIYKTLYANVCRFHILKAKYMLLYICIERKFKSFLSSFVSPAQTATKVVNKAALEVKRLWCQRNNKEKTLSQKQ